MPVLGLYDRPTIDLVEGTGPKLAIPRMCPGDTYAVRTGFGPRIYGIGFADPQTMILFVRALVHLADAEQGNITQGDKKVIAAKVSTLAAAAKIPEDLLRDVKRRIKVSRDKDWGNSSSSVPGIRIIILIDGVHDEKLELSIESAHIRVDSRFKHRVLQFSN